jgi:hypothetical protein
VSTVSNIATGTVQPTVAAASNLAASTAGAVSNVVVPVTGTVSGVTSSAVAMATIGTESTIQPVATFAKPVSITASVAPSFVAPSITAVAVANIGDTSTASDDAKALTAFFNSDTAKRARDGERVVRLVAKFADKMGRTCRKYLQIASIGGRRVQASAIVCKNSADTWRVIAPVVRRTAALSR